MLFSKTNPPERPMAPDWSSHNWLTWSDDFRSAFSAWKTSEGYAAVRPQLVYLNSSDTYNYSFSVEALNDALSERLLPFALELHAMNVGSEMLLFRDLINGDIGGEDLHVIFSVFQRLITRHFGFDMEAMYAPLTVSNNGTFPLHCDMYVPRYLWNIYDDVPTDESGASTFLPVKMLLEDILPKVGLMPASFRDQIRLILESNAPTDRYEELYRLLNSLLNPWHFQLRWLTNRYRSKFKFHRGEGYLIHDRLWLHGRTRPSGKITLNRVHRLIFNSGQFVALSTQGIRL